MSKNYFYDKRISNLEECIPGEYEQCILEGLDLSNAHLSGYQFVDCAFRDCNLSLANLFKTAFRDVNFKNCKMLGLKFETCNDFNLSFNFDHCQLNHCSFYGLKLKRTNFKRCPLQEVDFSHADLSEALFEDCDLKDATFDQSNLEKADLSSAYNYIIYPDSTRIKKARFSVHGLPGLLTKYDIKVVG